MNRRLSNLIFVCMIMAFVGLSVPFSGHAQKPTGDDKGNKMAKETVNYLDIPFKTITGEETNLEAFKGKVVLLVNVASECGFTPQYEGLETLYEKFKDSGQNNGAAERQGTRSNRRSHRVGDVIRANAPGHVETEGEGKDQ